MFAIIDTCVFSVQELGAVADVEGTAPIDRFTQP
jgi:hypothetical protein